MEQFGQFLIEVGQEERQVDIMRQVLVEQPNFTPYNLFRHVSGLSDKGTVGHKELSKFL